MLMQNFADGGGGGWGGRGEGENKRRVLWYFRLAKLGINERKRVWVRNNFERGGEGGGGGGLGG